MCPSITLVILVGEEVVCQYVNNSFAYRAIALLASLVLCLNNSFSVLRTPETAKPHSQSGLSPYLLMWFCFSNKDTALAASSRAVSLLKNYLDRVCTVFGVSLGHINLFLLCLTILEEVGSNLREQSVA
jgi:hypothetical protein